MKRSEETEVLNRAATATSVQEAEPSVLHGMAGLWQSGLYGIGFGALMGLYLGALAGAVAGSMVPVLGNIIGFFIGGLYGAVIGAIVGFPSAILGAGIGGQQGWRVGGAVPVFVAGVSYLWAFGGARAEMDGASWLPWWSVLIFAVLVQIGFWFGGIAFHRMEYREGFYRRWRQALHQSGVDQMGGVSRARALFWAMLPVVTVYAVALMYCLVQR